jgi:hypothetical protein
VHCSKVKLTQLQVVAHCLLASKLLAKAGALLTLRKLHDFQVIDKSIKATFGWLFY